MLSTQPARASVAGKVDRGKAFLNKAFLNQILLNQIGLKKTGAGARPRFLDSKGELA